MNIPYSSLTPELTKDFNERTSLNGYRFGFAGLGTLLGGGAALPIVGLFADKSVGFSVMGAIFGAVMMITALITVFTVREPETPADEGDGLREKLPGRVLKTGPTCSYCWPTCCTSWRSPS